HRCLVAAALAWPGFSGINYRLYLGNISVIVALDIDRGKIMFKFVTGVLAAACFVLLSGCKPSSVQSRTSENYASALLALKVQVQSRDVNTSTTAACRQFAAACARQALVQPATIAPVCTHFEVLRRLDSSVRPSRAALLAERGAWEAYADESDRQLL